jgi:hypothetical protein
MLSIPVTNPGLENPAYRFDISAKFVMRRFV